MSKYNDVDVHNSMSMSLIIIWYHVLCQWLKSASSSNPNGHRSPCMLAVARRGGWVLRRELLRFSGSDDMHCDEPSPPRLNGCVCLQQAYMPVFKSFLVKYRTQSISTFFLASLVSFYNSTDITEPFPVGFRSPQPNSIINHVIITFIIRMNFKQLLRHFKSLHKR